MRRHLGTKGLLMSFLIFQLLYQNFENTTRSAQAFESMSCDDSKISVGIIWSTLAAAATHGITWSFTKPGILRLISHLHLGAEYLLNVGLNDKQNRPERYSLIYLLWTMAMNRVSISRNSFVQPLITPDVQLDTTGPDLPDWE